jgi:hypothetical protein
MPSESLLLSRPGSLLAQTASARRSVQPASSGRPSSPRPAMSGRQPLRRSPVRVHHALSTHPVSSSGIRPSSRPVSSPSGVRSPGFVVRRPAVRMAGVHPSSVQLSGVQPSSVQPSSVQPSSVQPSGVPPPADVRPRRSGRASVSSTPGGGVGDQAGAAGRPSPQEPVEVPVGCRAVERLGQRPSRPGRGRRCRGRALVSGGVADGLAGLGAGGRACPLSDQAGQAGVRSAVAGGGARAREQAGGARWPRLPRDCRPRAGWATTVRGRRGACRPGGRARKGRWACRRYAGGDGRAAPTRPRLTAGAPGSLSVAL